MPITATLAMAGDCPGASPAGHDAPGLGAPRYPLATSILQLIWRERRISRAEIARRLGARRSSVSEAIAALRPPGLVAEVGRGPSRGGRRPIVLEFQDGARCIVGADVGSSHVGVALTDLRGQLLAWEERPHPVRADPRGTSALVIELAEACLARAGRGAGRLLGIGVAMPSPVEPRAPHGLSRRVLPAWEGRCGLEALRAHFGVPALADNDANLGALAECRWGAGRGIDDLAFVKVGTGVGCGLVIGGRIYRGAGGSAGELGHLALDPAGPPCLCGQRGCLETLVGAQALVARTRALLREGRPSTLRGREPSVREVEDAARGGDPLALEVVGEAAERLGVAVAGVLNVLDPAMVVLGGGLTRAGLPLLQPLRSAARVRTLSSSACEVVITPLGPPAVALGAATLVLEAALAEPRGFFLGGARA